MDWKPIVFIVCAVITTATGMAGLLALEGGTRTIPSPGFYLDTTDTQEIANAGWRGRGVFAGPDGITNELLSRSAFILSHRPSGRSQDITFQSKVSGVTVPSTGCIIDDARYVLYLSKDGNTWTNWQTFRTSSGGGVSGTFTFDAKMTNVIGYEAEGALRADFAIHCWLGSWVPMAQDWAYLRMGIGDIDADKQAAVGETITVTWDIPYITAEGGAGAPGSGETGFYLIGNHMDTGKEITNQKLESLQGNFKYKVLKEDWVPGSGGECADNIIRWRLRNELWNIDWQDTTTIDVAGEGPTVINLKWDSDAYEIGDTATLSWDIELGPHGYEIDHQKVVWGFGEPTTETTLNGTATSFTTQGITETGKLHGEVIAYDTACRASPVADVYSMVQDPNIPPTTGGGKVFPLWEVLLLSIVFIAITIMVIVIAYVMNTFGIPVQYTAVAAIIIFVVLSALVIILAQGPITKIAEWMA